ncbi:multidrug resistance-associated protein [Aspergillus pseudonomiae]|uniref:Multidrug resistance-associated protein n=1 Tax=Aspergillus pseudonomiae TaxID=1506151 RepID=A0A5N7DLS2_9EURO|nr:multidrug resistance-associated protein [Aspergillus pseudonomiae]KAE8407397.1 multidrug resistance-associated protein [Aspergillus pseudonomiae]
MQVLAVSLLVVQITLVALGARQPTIRRRESLAGAILELVAGLAVVIITDLEHIRSIRPSFLVSAYLFATILCDLVRVRNAWLLSDSQAYAGCLSLSLTIKLLLLILENVEKRKWLKPSQKMRSSESLSGLFSRGLFAWLNGLLWKGYSMLLSENSLPRIHEKLASRDLSAQFAESWTSSNQSRQNALLLTVISCLRWEILTIAFPRICVVGFSIAQPFLVGKTVTILEQNDSFSLDKGYSLIGATAIVFIGVAVCTACYQHLGYRVTTMLRGGLMAIVFQHLMNLPSGSVDESSAISLMGTDIEMLAEYFQSTVCEIWANIIQLGLATWLLQTQVGAVCIAPIVVVIIFTVASLGMGNTVSARQQSWLQATEKRINFTTGILGSIQNIKFLGLTEIMGAMINALRVDELRVSKRFRRIQTVRVCMVNLPTIVGQLATFAGYAIVAMVQGSGGLKVSQAITSLSLVNLLVTPLSNLLLAIPDTFASIGCLTRIQDFLRKPGRIERRQIAQIAGRPPLLSPSSSTIELPTLEQHVASPVLEKQPDIVLSLNNVHFGWKDSLPDKPRLSLTLRSSPNGNLVMIVGPVGSGKSTFLRGLAGETPVLEGELFMKYPDLAFCEQASWLTNTSIRESIIGENLSFLFDSEWYHTVVRACGLEPDLKRLPAGDQTLVGSKGAKLSGGQKQRIAIARAVYARKRIACFDDVLSGLDNGTAHLVFNNVFGPAGLLRRLGCTAFLATHSGHHLPHADFIIVLGNNGKVLEQGSYAQLRSHAGGYIHTLGMQSIQTDRLAETLDISEKDHQSQNTATGSLSAPSATHVTRQANDLAVYKYYFSSLGGLRVSMLLLFLIVNAGIDGFRYVWVDIWSSSRDGASNSRLGYRLGLYAALAVIEASALIFAVFWTWVVIVPAASKNLHSIVLRACMNAPLSFLSNTETGVLVTRFSQDMRLVDMILPRGFISTGFLLFGALAQGAVVIASLPYMAAALPVLIGVLVLVQRFYLRTSRQLRLLEIELKSPLYTHFIESLAGVVTIRAFSWTHASVSRMLSMLDTAQKPFYLLLSIQRWLSLVLNLIVAALTVLLVGAGLALRRHVDPGLLGVALVLMVDLGQTLSELIQNWTLLETSLGAIARIKDFAENTPSEDRGLDTQTAEPRPEWPPHGEIMFVDASIAYDATEGAKPVLDGINLHIRAGEKVGLCGKSGSGKSSLALSLLRLNEIVSGQILIDGQDISAMSRSTIRQRISCLSQEPFLFPGTIRQNVDPLNILESQDIINALRCVGVWNALVAHHGGNDERMLDSKFNEEILSNGQKQLFCLARALLKKSKILLLDEPTSSLDSKTDARVQKVIRESFADCTVIMVAHRIHTLLDFDRVAVLDSGRIIETGHPRELLDKPDGAFAKLLELEA